MEGYKKRLHTFLTLHAHKATTSDEPVAHLHFHDDANGLGIHSPLLVFTVEDVLEALNKESELVRQLLKQMHTYDCTCQCIVGLIFDEKTVVSEVLRRT